MLAVFVRFIRQHVWAAVRLWTERRGRGRGIGQGAGRGPAPPCPADGPGDGPSVAWRGGEEARNRPGSAGPASWRSVRPSDAEAARRRAAQTAEMASLIMAAVSNSFVCFSRSSTSKGRAICAESRPGPRRAPRVTLPTYKRISFPSAGADGSGPPASLRCRASAWVSHRTRKGREVEGIACPSPATLMVEAIAFPSPARAAPHAAPHRTRQCQGPNTHAIVPKCPRAIWCACTSVTTRHARHARRARHARAGGLGALGAARGVAPADARRGTRARRQWAKGMSPGRGGEGRGGATEEGGFVKRGHGET
jgi:hypothetical protein